MDPVLEGLWNDVVTNWDDDKSHGKLVGYAQTTEQLAQVAAFYRKVIDVESPFRMREDQVLDAKKRLDGIVLLATLSMGAERDARAPGPPAWVKSLAAVFLLACVAVLAWALYTGPGVATRGDRRVPQPAPQR